MLADMTGDGLPEIISVAKVSGSSRGEPCMSQDNFNFELDEIEFLLE